MRFFLLISIFLLLTTTAQAEVRIGSSQITKKEQSSKPKTSRPSHLARSVAEMFRYEATELRDTLINRSLKAVPKSKQKENRKELEKHIDIGHILNLYAKTLHSYYTEDELKALRTFMADETNRQMLEKLPIVMSQMGLDRQQYLNTVLQNMLQKEMIDKLKQGESSILNP